MKRFSATGKTGVLKAVGIILSVLWMLIPVVLHAQLQIYNHPELEWRTIETEYFYVHFHQGTERTAALVAKIAGEIFDPITGLYGYVPDTKIHFIIRDHDDTSNGVAFYYDNKIELWAPAMNFHLRGTHNWLRDVVSHEFSHMISLGAARKIPRQIPAVYLQWMGYEEEKRPDVIHGYPNTLISFPVAGTVIPMWFAEGIAQYQCRGLNYDTWDTHRDMLLRSAVRENRLLTLTEMGIFGKRSLGNELVYNQGYGLTLYIAHQYGQDALRKLARAQGRLDRIGFSGACREVLGKSEKEIYSEWLEWLKQGYEYGKSSSGRESVQGIVLESGGEGNFYPVFSPSGRRLAYVSSQGRAYMSQLRLLVKDLGTGKKRTIAQAVPGPVSWSPDGTRLIYAKATGRTSSGSHYYDLYTYHLEKRRETRLTRFRRTAQPAWSPDGKTAACVIQKDGTSNLAILDLETKKLRVVTRFADGEQIYAPRWMPGGGTLVFSLAAPGPGRDIAMVDSSGGNLRYVIRTSHDERDPVPGREPGTLIFSSDSSGIFNLYEFNLKTDATARLTDIEGGAFMPATGAQGWIAYSLFTGNGYRLALLKNAEDLSGSAKPYVSPYQKIRKERRENLLPAGRYDDRQVPEFKSRPYTTDYQKLAFLPRIMVDYPGRLKLGTYFYGSDFLDRISLFGGAAINFQADADVFTIFQYKRFYPTLFLEGFYQARHTSEEDIDVRFDLLEADVGAEWRLGDADLLRTAYVYSRYDARMTFTDQGQKIKFPYTYHIGSVVQARLTHTRVPAGFASSIAPSRGRRITLEVNHAWQRFLDGFEVHPKFGTIVETYKPYRYFQVSLDWREYVSIPRLPHSLAIRLKAGWIDRAVDGFYHFFAGGLDGMKGYPYYSLEGRKLIHFGLAYRFPVFRKMGLRFLFLNMDHLYLSLYGDVGNAWSVGDPDLSSWKKDVGVQMRMRLFNFYAYPMSFFLDAAYGLDRFEHMGQTYGRQWRTYVGLLFDFLD
jgi:Tol biopolymer transport system component